LDKTRGCYVIRSKKTTVVITVTWLLVARLKFEFMSFQMSTQLLLLLLVRSSRIMEVSYMFVFSSCPHLYKCNYV